MERKCQLDFSQILDESISLQNNEKHHHISGLEKFGDQMKFSKYLNYNF